MEWANLSVEIGHLYLQELRSKGDDSAQAQYVQDRILAGAVALGPAIRTYLAHKKVVSTSVLIDDYFWTPGSGPSPEDLAELITSWRADFLQTHGISIDFIVFESSLADTVKTLHRRLMSLPIGGCGL